VGLGDNDAVYIEVSRPQPVAQPRTIPAQAATAGPQSSSGSTAQSAAISSIIGSLVKNIKTPAQAKNEDRTFSKKIFDSISADPSRLEALRNQIPPMAAAFENAPTDYGINHDMVGTVYSCSYHFHSRKLPPSLYGVQGDSGAPASLGSNRPE